MSGRFSEKSSAMPYQTPARAAAAAVYVGILFTPIRRRRRRVTNGNRVRVFSRS